MASSMDELECFKVGAQVEVCLEEVGFRGSWYAATVARAASRRTGKILLEFHNLMSDGEGRKRLKEFVQVVLVRPVPPREAHRAFAVSEEVDAYHNDGWWEGVVISVLEGSRYSVYFRCSREQMDFAGSDLRLHREWVHGNWVPPLEEDPSHT
ncbi:hypothetical protein RJ639_033596 [Escallonia herrerae]|uniref:Agenet domain-containing protein n=1 Tax=Escallonia herrerae TaxID=1293975 RepID=A0AA88WUZ0_9ASTE|nr:hypothetical protein RJ639_033596 [Escallonia herrerae]